MYRYLHLNYICNLNCKFCASDATNSKESREISDQDLEKFLQSIQQGDVVHISGGEPTVDKRLLSIVKIINKKSDDITISTNAVKLGDKKYLDTLIDAGVTAFAVSIFATNSKVYNELTLSKSYNKYLMGLKNLTKSNVRFILKYLLIALPEFVIEGKSISKWLKEECIEADEYQISGLHLSNKVIKRSSELIYGPNSLSNRLNNELKYADLSKTYIQEIPLCYLENENLQKYLEEGILRNTADFEYYKVDSSGIRNLVLKNPYAQICSSCEISTVCSVINPNNMSLYQKKGYENHYQSVLF